jgi:hypothetical protein
MRRFTIRLLTLVICGTALLIVPIATSAKAATNGIADPDKGKKKIREIRGISDRASKPSSWPPTSYEDDPDRKTGGGGGM